VSISQYVYNKTGSFYGVADCSDMETEVSDELKRKKAKKVASKKKSKEGESGVENVSISKEISSKITFVDETQTTDTTGSCHGIADSSDMESVLTLVMGVMMPFCPMIFV